MEENPDGIGLVVKVSFFPKDERFPMVGYEGKAIIQSLFVQVVNFRGSAEIFKIGGQG